MPRLISLAESSVFRLDDFDLDDGDKLELWVTLIEKGALRSRLCRGRPTQVQPLAGLASLWPPMSKRSLYDLSDRDCDELVATLRLTADQMREDKAAQLTEREG